LNSHSSAAERPEFLPAEGTVHSDEAEVDAEDDHVTIIINLEESKITSTPHGSDPAGRSSDYLQTLGITVSKTDDQRI
jgi:hypothetical protein